LGGVIEVERGRRALRHLALVRALRQLHDADRAVGPGDGEAPAGKLDVAFGCFERLGCGLLAFLHDQRGRLDDRLSARGDRARAAGAAAESHEVAVILLQRNLLEGHAELRRKYLRERRGMALAVIERAGGEFYRAIWLECDLAKLAARGCGYFEIGADRDATQLAGLAALLLAFGKVGVIGNFDRPVEHALEIAAVIGHAGRGREG